MTVRVRAARSAAHLGLVEDLQVSIFSAEDLHAIRGVRWWLAWDGDAPVGFGGVKLLGGVDAGTAYLCLAGVVPEARGRGVQRELLKARLRWAKARGCTCAISFTHRLNLTSANNMIQAGMRLYQPARPWAGRDAFYVLAFL